MWVIERAAGARRFFAQPPGGFAVNLWASGCSYSCSNLLRKRSSMRSEKPPERR